MKVLNKKVCVIGLGYIGLPTAAVLAKSNYMVRGVDTNHKLVDSITNSKELHLSEPKLNELVNEVINSGNLVASSSVDYADIFLIAVPTPFKSSHEPDLSYVEAAVKNITPFIKEGNLIIVESTVPVGTMEKVQQWITEFNPHLNKVYYAHCPERVIPGSILVEIIENDRVIGGLDQKSTEYGAEFYATFVKGGIFKTDSRTAELCKLAENSFRDVNIAYANELSIICDKLKINVWELIRLANRHPRVNILEPGPGVGGHCIAVDPWFIVDSAKDESKLIRTAREVNDSKPQHIIEQVVRAIGKEHNYTIACLGLTYKPDIDDLRESPALLIAKQLQQMKIGRIIACEPNVKQAEICGMLNVSLSEALSADVIVVLVKHKEFKLINQKDLVHKLIIDTRGIM